MLCLTYFISYGFPRIYVIVFFPGNDLGDGKNLEINVRLRE